MLQFRDPGRHPCVFVQGLPPFGVQPLDQFQLLSLGQPLGIRPQPHNPSILHAAAKRTSDYGVSESESGLQTP